MNEIEHIYIDNFIQKIYGFTDLALCPMCFSDTAAKRTKVGIRRSGRTFMTAEDVSELKDVFKEYLTEKRIPSVKEINKNLKASRRAGGNIWQCDARKLQKTLSAMVISRKKCQCTI